MAKQDRMLEHSCIFEMLTMGMCVGIGDVDLLILAIHRRRLTRD